MFDRALLPLVEKVLEGPARALGARGVSANVITLAGFGIGLIACLFVVFQWYTLALLGLGLNRLADGLDGRVARMGTPTDRGAFLDVVLDFWFYSLFPMAFAVADPAANALPAAVLIASFAGTGSSFLAFSIIAGKRGLTAADYPTKGIYYLGGLTEGTETIAVLAAFCLFPTAFPVIAYVFAALCTVTTLTRWLAGWRMFG